MSTSNTSLNGGLKEFNWTVKVNIASGENPKLLEPTVACDLQLAATNTTDNIKFESPIDKFHLLRYSTADLLQSLKKLQAQKVMQN